MAIGQSSYLGKLEESASRLNELAAGETQVKLDLIGQTVEQRWRRIELFGRQERNGQADHYNGRGRRVRRCHRRRRHHTTPGRTRHLCRASELFVSK